MKKKIISRIESNFIIIIFLISGIQIIVFPLIKQTFKFMVFSEIPYSKIDFYCKKDKVIKASKTYFIRFFCERISEN